MRNIPLLFLVLSFALIPSGLWAQGTAYYGAVRTSTGNAISGANVAVCNYPASLGTAPCSSLASLYMDAALTEPITNPIISDSDGNYNFFAVPGTYVIQTYGPSITTQTFNVSLPSPAERIAGVYRVGNQTYPCTAPGINAAITAATTNGNGAYPGGVVDARACVGNVAMSEPILVGDSSADPVTLLLPTGALWTFTVSGSSSCDIEQFPNTVIEGPGKDGGGGGGGGGGGIAGGMRVQSAAGSTPYANFCTYTAVMPGSNYEYFHTSGFLVQNPNGVLTTSGYSIVLKGAADNSVFANIEAADGTNNGFLISNDCCGASFYNLTSNAGDTGGVPLTVGEGTGTLGDHEINFFGGSFDHARAGDNQILFNEPPYIGGPINFYGTYVEGNDSTADTVPFVETGANGIAYGLHFYGLTIFPMEKETVYGIHIPQSQHMHLTVSGMWMRTEPNAIQDERHGVNITADPYGRVPTYDTVGFLSPSGTAGLVPVTAQKGTVTLTSGSGSASLTFKSTPICAATDTTAANAVKASSTAKTLTLTGTGSDVVSYICIGNPN
jgi:hypothetical protein